MSDVTEPVAPPLAREMPAARRPAASLGGLRDRVATKPPQGRRPWRLLAALGLLGAGLLAIADDLLTLTTDHAVVTGYAVGVQSPIAGRVAGLAVRQGALVEAGAPIATIENDRADPARVAELTGRLARARAEQAANEAALAALDQLSAELRERQARHVAVAEQWYAAQTRQAQGQLAAAEARVQRTERDRERKEKLGSAGFATGADLEQARMEATVAREQVAAIRAQVAALATQRAAVPQGIFMEAGHSGAGYAAQRLDEVRLRQAELRRATGALAAEITALAPQLAEAEAVLAARRTASLTAPAAGMVWRVLAQDGERLAEGASVAELVECRAAFLLAALPQSGAADVRPGQAARVRLDGDRADFQGTVTAVLGGTAAAERGNLAAVPTQPRGGTVLVRVALPEAALAEGCPVGRVARLVLPPAEGGVLAGLAALLP